MLAALVTQATGCILSSDGGESAFITADWSFRNIGTNTTTGCPSGFSTVELHNQEVDLDDRPILGTEVIDLFDCIDIRHESAPLDPVAYETWIEVRDGEAGPLYATSLSQIVDVTFDDKPFNTVILNDGGYFEVAWNLRGRQTNASLSCRDVANLDGVEIISTVTGGTQAVITKFECEDGFDISNGLLQGSYTVSIDAYDDALGALGPPVNLTNRIVDDRNDITDLGTVNLLIDGL
jgi:hypothetical protein